MDPATEQRLLEVLDRLAKLPDKTEALVLAHKRLADEVNANGKLVSSFSQKLSEFDTKLDEFGKRLNELENRAKVRDAECVLRHEEINTWRKSVDGDLTDSKVHDRATLLAQVDAYGKQQVETQRTAMTLKLESWKLWLAIIAILLGGTGGGAVFQRVMDVLYPSNNAPAPAVDVTPPAPPVPAASKGASQ